MKIVLPGGSGQVGRILFRHFGGAGHECVILSRSLQPRKDLGPGVRCVAWDGRTPGAWCREIDGADVVINLAGRSVDCRYTTSNLNAMMRSRVESTRIVGAAIAGARVPPRVWLQAGTATIYAHRYDRPNDELSGAMGGHEPDAPALWRKSVEIALAWEAEVAAAPTPHTRKVVLRSAMIMSADRGGVFDRLATLARWGLGRQGDGRQYVSWIHETDFTAAVAFLISRDDLAGAINLAAPEPLPNCEFTAALSAALGRAHAVPIPRWALEIGATFLRTETELILKSRRVVPGRLSREGFAFEHPNWPEAAEELVRRWKSNRSKP